MKIILTALFVIMFFATLIIIARHCCNTDLKAKNKNKKEEKEAPYTKLTHLVRYKYIRSSCDYSYWTDCYPLMRYVDIKDQLKAQIYFDDFIDTIKNVCDNYEMNVPVCDVAIKAIQTQVKICQVENTKENKKELVNILDLIKESFLNMAKYGLDVDKELVYSYKDSLIRYNEISEGLVNGKIKVVKYSYDDKGERKTASVDLYDIEDYINLIKEEKLIG